MWHLLFDEQICADRRPRIEQLDNETQFAILHHWWNDAVKRQTGAIPSAMDQDHEPDIELRHQGQPYPEALEGQVAEGYLIGQGAYLVC